MTKPGRIVGVQLTDASATLELHPEQSREGYLRVAVKVARPGIYDYTLMDGKVIKILRPRSEVFKAESLESLKGKPVTRKHPSQLLTAATARGAMTGSTGSVVTVQDDYITTEAFIYDQPTVQALKAGNDEVSPGYHVVIVQESGVDPEFGPYDCWVEDIFYNHLAVALGEGEARGGEGCRALMDSKDLTLTKTEDIVADKMKKIKLGDGEHEVTEALHDAIQSHLSQLDEQHKANHDKLAEGLAAVKHKHGELKDDMESMAEETNGEEEEDSKDGGKKSAEHMDAKQPKTDEGKALKAVMVKRLQRASAKVASLMDSASPEKLAAAATERARIVGVVCAMDSKAVATDLFKLDNLELMKQAILLRTPKAQFEGMDSNRIAGQFDMVAATVNSNVGLALGNALLDAKTTPEKKETAAAKPWTPEPLSHSKRPALKA